MHDDRQIPSAKTHASRLGFWVTLSAVLWLGGGLLTGVGLGPWYESLEFPPYQPPGWVFTPAWLVILSLLAIATNRIASLSNEERLGHAKVAFGLYGFQFGLNLGWSVLFFAVRRPDAALWEIVVLDIVVLAMTVIYSRIDKKAGLMLVPYFVWLLFATAINAWIAIYNGPFPMT
ncbi:MAG: TspO/MBR family protein [Planctomycetota bacterium]